MPEDDEEEEMMKMYYCCSAFQKSQASQFKNILKSTKNHFNLLFFSKAPSQQV